jgi:hypothetical protein
MSVPFDSDRVKNRIKESLDKLYTEVDPALLNRYRGLFKQEVSLFKRSYFAAYLLWEADQKGGRFPARRYQEGASSEGSGRYRRLSEEGRAPREGDAPRVYPLAEEESIRLFVSIGRSRRVFPREILGLILSKTSISKDDIGAIRILDNYSFVQVRTTVAELIIESLNGKPFRGRPLSVNYARSRKDADNPDSEPGDSAASFEGSAMPEPSPEERSIPHESGFVEEDDAEEGSFDEDDGFEDEEDHSAGSDAEQKSGDEDDKEDV